jgi:hypothetical protein
MGGRLEETAMQARPPASTPKRRAFDLAFGIFLPVFCLLADPVVFRDPIFHGASLLPACWRGPAFALCGLGMVGFAGFLFTSGSPSAWRLLLLPPLLVGALTALGLAAVVLPIAVVALAMVIGIAGFVHVFTAFAYLRAVWETLCEHPSRPRAARALMGTTVLVIALASALFVLESLRQERVDAAVRALARGDDESTEEALEVLAELGSARALDLCWPLFERYGRMEPEGDGRARLRRIYGRTTGRDLAADAEYHGD